MAMIGKISIAMVTNTAPLAKGLKASSAMVTGFAAKVEQTSMAMKGLFAAAAAGGAAAAISKTVGAASSLSDAVLASKTVFGDASEYIIKQAQAEADAFGTSKRAFIEASTSFGSMMQGAGKSADESARLGVEITRVARDMGKLRGLKAEEAFTAIGAAMRGEFDPAERLGLFLKADAVAAKAVAMGLSQSAATASDGAKKMATLAIIQEQGAKAAGFFAKNQGQFSAQSEALWGRIENLSAAIGEQLLPIATALMEQFNTGLTVVSNLWGDVGNSAVNSASNTIGAVQQSSLSVGILQQGIGFVADAWQVMGMAGTAVMAALQDLSSKIYYGIARIAEGLEWVAKQFGMAELGAAKFFDDISAGMKVMSDDTWKKFDKSMYQAWNHDKVNSFFEDAQKKTAALRKDLAKTPSAIGGPAGGKAAATAANPGKVSFASQMEAGSKEAVNTLLRSRYGSSISRGPAEQTAKNTSKANELLGKIATAIGGGAALRGASPAFGNF